MSRWSLQRRLVVGIGGIGAVTLLAMLAVVMLRSSALAKEQAEDYAVELGQAAAWDATADIADAFQSANDFAAVIANLRDSSLARTQSVNTLEAVLQSNPSFLGTWTGWDRLTFDGRDDLTPHKGVSTDDSGRFVPYVVRSGDEIMVTPLVDYDTPGAGDYYLIAHDSGQSKLIDPYVYEVDGVAVLMTSVAVPILEEGVPVGVAGVDLTLDSIQDLVGDLEIYDSGTGALYTSSGVIVAHPNDAVEATVAEGHEADLVRQAVEAGEAITATHDGKLQVAVPVPLGEVDTWVMVVEAPLGEVLADANQLRNLVIALALVGIAVIVLAGWFLGRRLGRRVAAQAITIGEVAEGFSGSTIQIDREASTVASRAQDVSANAAMVSERVETVAAAIEELTASTRVIAGQTRDATEVADEAVETVRETEVTVGKLGESSQSIGAVVDVITAIAEQTNLLALNATIEAARAGEAGKGFAVVADEVKELARQTGEATKDISARIAQIRTDSDGAVRAIGGVADVITQISNIQQAIASAASQQESAAAEIAASVSEAASGSAEIANAAAALADAAGHSRQLATALHEATGGLTAVAAELQAVVGSKDTATTPAT